MNLLRQQILIVINLYNVEVEKNQNLKDYLNDIVQMLRELFHFCKQIFLHIQRSQKETHGPLIEQFLQTFTSIRWKLPRDIDKDFEKELGLNDKDKNDGSQSGRRLSKRKSMLSSRRSTLSFFMS